MKFFTYRVDTDKQALTDDYFRKYPDLVREADRKELSQFVHYNVFKKRHFSRLPPGANLVDYMDPSLEERQGEKQTMCSRLF